MKFVRFEHHSGVYSGIISNGKVEEIEGDMLGDWKPTGKTFPIEAVKLISPVIPNKIIGIGANFVAKKSDLPRELPEIPIFFFKPASSVIGPNDEIVIPAGIEDVKFESELAVVIGKQAKSIPEKKVLDYVFGYTVGNDVTAPQFFREDGHWTIGKAFDTFTPLGPAIETELDPLNVVIRATVNGDEKQNSKAELMIVPIKKMISYLSTIMTLLPGDIILTGSPLGAEFIRDGDLIECQIDPIGSLQNRVVKQQQS